MRCQTYLNFFPHSGCLMMYMDPVNATFWVAIVYNIGHKVINFLTIVLYHMVENKFNRKIIKFDLLKNDTGIMSFMSSWTELKMRTKVSV